MEALGIVVLVLFVLIPVWLPSFCRKFGDSERSRRFADAVSAARKSLAAGDVEGAEANAEIARGVRHDMSSAHLYSDRTFPEEDQTLRELEATIERQTPPPPAPVATIEHPMEIKRLPSGYTITGNCPCCRAEFFNAQISETRGRLCQTCGKRVKVSLEAHDMLEGDTKTVDAFCSDY